MPSGLNDSGLTQTPGSWEGADVTNGYEYDSDSGSSSSVENISTFTDVNQEPGEVWAYKIRLTLSSEPTSGIVGIEHRNEDGDIISRSFIPEYGGNETILQTVVPTYELNGEFSGPSSDNADGDISVNNVSGSSFNYFVDTYAIRLRGPLDQTSLSNPQDGSLTSGTL